MDDIIYGIIMCHQWDKDIGNLWDKLANNKRPWGVVMTNKLMTFDGD